MSFNTPDGRIGLLRGALPRIVAVAKGRVEIRECENAKSFLCDDGIVMIKNNGVVLLTESCNAEDDIASQENQEISVRRKESKEYDYAKAKIAAQVAKMRDKSGNIE